MNVVLYFMAKNDTNFAALQSARLYGLLRGRIKDQAINLYCTDVV